MGLRRARHDRWISGVCGGIAHTYGYKPWVVRLVVALLAVLVPGVSVIPAIIIYALMAYFVPESDLF